MDDQSEDQREQPSTLPSASSLPSSLPDKHRVPEQQAEEYESGYVTSPNTVENTTPARRNRSSTAKPFPGVPSCKYIMYYNGHM